MSYHAEWDGATLVYEVENGTVLLDIRDEVRARDAGYYVMPDIDPYKSMLTGETVQSRSKHRDLLREHKCVEVGDQTHYLRQKDIKPPPGLKQTLIDVFNSKT